MKHNISIEVSDRELKAAERVLSKRPFGKVLDRDNKALVAGLLRKIVGFRK